jgi:hypothetical protein
VNESLPEAFRHSVDTNSIIAYGHSLGGATAAGAAYADSRILGGMDIDGSLYGPVVSAGLDKPFILAGRHAGEAGDSPPWTAFYENLRGPKMMAVVNGTTHYSYVDVRLLLTTQDIPDDMIPLVEELAGTVDGARLEAIVQGILAGFAALTLRGEADTLLSINETFPEVIVRREDLFVE